MTDAEALHDLVHRYSDAVCRRDVEAWATTWDVDGEWDSGRGPSTGRVAITAAFEKAISLFEAVVQLVHNGSATVQGDTGHGRWYMSEAARTRTGRNLHYLFYYDDEYVRRPDGWHFGRRTLTWLYDGPPDLSGRFGPPPVRRLERGSPAPSPRTRKGRPGY